MNVLVLGCIWVVAATGTALLPMKYQIYPGLPLLFAAPLLLWMIWQDYGLLPLLLGTAAFVSMFRRPLRHLMRRALGRPSDVPR